MATFHVCFDLDGLIHRGGARELAGLVRLPGGQDMATEAELVAHATVLKARGFKVMPACSSYDEQGHCKGHRDES